MNGHKYFLTVIDDHTRYCWIFLMKLKSEASLLVQSFTRFSQTQFKTTSKVIWLDNGPAFTLKHFHLTNGIHHQNYCIYTPQQNGPVERKHQHFLNVTRDLLLQFKLPKVFWSHALTYVIFLIN